MKKKFFISFILSSICFSLIFTFVGFSLENKAQKLETNIVEDEKIDDSKENDKSVLVLMMGVDGTDVFQEKGLRTDTMILGKADFKTGEVDLLSIPRDTRVLVNGREDKINHAHSYGGPDLALETVENFLDLNIDYYVKVDFTGIREMVNAIGGVEIDVPVRMRYYDPVAKPPLNIDLQPGRQHLDGDKAHDFLRFRSYPNGDIGRVEAQQYFMKELAKQVLKPSNLFKLDKLIKTYYDYVDTNIPLTNLLKYSISANKLDIENMNTGVVPGRAAYINELSYWIYDEIETKALVNRMFYEYKK